MRLRAWVFTAALFAESGSSARAETVYSNNFDGLRTMAPGVAALEVFVSGTDSVDGFAGVGPTGNQFSGKFVRNMMYGNPQNNTRLMLTNLPQHDSISIGFLLAIIDSWDGLITDYPQQPTYIPDYFNVTVDGQTVLQASYDNAATDGIHENPAGVPLAVRVQMGYGLEPTNQVDSAYDLSNWDALKFIPHTASTADIRFFASGAGWEGYTESWGMDNLRVQVHSSPAPSIVPGAEVPLPGVAWGAAALFTIAAANRFRKRIPA